MRYLAQRIGTGQWLHKDLPLADVERSRVLSGPSTITATVQPALRDQWAADGLRILDEWSTYVYAVTDDGSRVTGGGILVEAAHEDTGAFRMTFAGPSTYPQGFIYDSARNWGPIVGEGTTAKPDTPRPDPLRIVQDLWDFMQDYGDSDLGVHLVGTLSSGETVGNYAEPYRLRWWETPDVGQEIDRLAAETPFDYAEEYLYDPTRDAVHKYIRLGYPRLGRQRNDLRFVLGENVLAAPPAATVTSEFANHIIGIGNGEGRKMVRADSVVSDGRLRRMQVYTDKTVTSQQRLHRYITGLREKAANTLDITNVVVADHPNAPLSAIGLGDDIYVDTYVESYGPVQMWLRVLGISEGDNPGVAVLSTRRSTAFLYASPRGGPEAVPVLPDDPAVPPPPVPDPEPDPPVGPEQPVVIPDPAPPGDPATLRVAVVSLSLTRPHNRSLVRFACRDADVVLGSEAADVIVADLLPQGWRSLQVTGGRDANGRPKDRGRAGVFVAVRTSRVTVTGQGLVHGVNPDGSHPRWIKWVEVKAGGRSTRLLAADWPPPTPAALHTEYTTKVRQTIGARTSGVTAVFGGDTNLTRDDSLTLFPVYASRARGAMLLASAGAAVEAFTAADHEGSDRPVIRGVLTPGG